MTLLLPRLLSAGSPPPELAGRTPLLEQGRLTLGRVKAGRPERSFFLIGLRGVGKTVLLNKMRELADASGYSSVLIEAHEGKPLAALLLPALRQLMVSLDRMAQISQKVKRGLRVLRSFFDGLKLKYPDLEIGVDVDPETGVADSGSLEADLAQMFVALGEAAQDRGTAVALIIDWGARQNQPGFARENEAKFVTPLRAQFHGACVA